MTSLNGVAQAKEGDLLIVEFDGPSGLEVGPLVTPLGKREFTTDDTALKRLWSADSERKPELLSEIEQEIRPKTEKRIKFPYPPEKSEALASTGSRSQKRFARSLFTSTIFVPIMTLKGVPAAMVELTYIAPKKQRIPPPLNVSLLPLAGLVKGLEGEDLVAMVKYLQTQITRLGVKTRKVVEFRPSEIEALKPDAVILAVGGQPAIPEIPGINRRNGISGPDLHKQLKLYLRFFGVRFLRWLTKFWMPLGKRVIVIGGEIQGAELAEFLVKRGRKVTIINGDKEVGDGLPRRKQQRLVEWLGEKGVKVITNAKCEEITDKGLIITTKDGVKQLIEADTITPAMPFKPNIRLFDILKGKVPELFFIGDGAEPRLILDAIADGWRTARAI